MVVWCQRLGSQHYTSVPRIREQVTLEVMSWYVCSLAPGRKSHAWLHLCEKHWDAKHQKPLKVLWSKSKNQTWLQHTGPGVTALHFLGTILKALCLQNNVERFPATRWFKLYVGLVKIFISQAGDYYFSTEVFSRRIPSLSSSLVDRWW